MKFPIDLCLSANLARKVSTLDINSSFRESKSHLELTEIKVLLSQTVEI